MWVSPLKTTEKRDSPDRQVIMDLSFSPGNSVNDRIPEDSYLGKNQFGLPFCWRLDGIDPGEGQGLRSHENDMKHAHKADICWPRGLELSGDEVEGSPIFWHDHAHGVEVLGNVLSKDNKCSEIHNEVKRFGLVVYLDDMVSA